MRATGGCCCYLVSAHPHVCPNLCHRLEQADEDPALFWKLAASWKPQATSSAERCWQGLLAASEADISPGMRRVLRASLALRQYSARLQMLRQLADGSRPVGGACCWALVGGQVVTDPSRVAAAVAAAEPAGALPADAPDGVRVYAFDHVYQRSGAEAMNTSDPELVPAILYAQLGSPCSAAFHRELAAAADSRPALAYAWRPYMAGSGEGGACDPSGCARLGTGDRLVLPGYGVEMAIKNMEYNARDDSKKKVGAASAAARAPAASGAGDGAGAETRAHGRRQVEVVDAACSSAIPQEVTDDGDKGKEQQQQSKKEESLEVGWLCCWR